VFGAFKNRRPWAAALINFILGPLAGMLYLNRGWYALLYFLGSEAVAVGAFPFLVSLNSSYRDLLLGIAIRVVAAIHAAFIAKNFPMDQGRKWYSHWYAVLGLGLILPAATALLFRSYLFQPFDIRSASMEPTLEVGDYLFVSKFAYRYAFPQRGDLVVFRDARSGTNYVKRIVALGDDRIQMKDGRLFINGVEAPQRRITDRLEDCGQAAPCHVLQFEEMLPGGAVANVLDRVDQGPADDTDIFTVPTDSYFVLGDNRDNSQDSRNGMGFVARSAIVGRVAYKFFAGGHWTWQPVR